MEFQLIEPEPGHFEIVQIVPSHVGTFADRETAEKVLGFLEMDALNNARKAELSTSAAAPIVPADSAELNAAVADLQRQPPSKLPVLPEASSKEVIPAENGSKSDVPHFDWTEPELAGAFRRLERGEKLKEVAKSYRKSWTVLRGKWAVHSKLAQPSETAAAPAPQQATVTDVVAAVRQLQNQENCGLCDRPFTPGPDSMGTCARCSQDI